MNSKERVLAAAGRKPTDRPPCGLRLTAEAADALQRYLGVATPNDVFDELDVDLRFVSIPFTGPKELSATPLMSEGTDFWGCRTKRVENDYGAYFEIDYHPLAHAETVSDVESHSWPSLDWWDYSAIGATIAESNRVEPRAILYWAGGAFETPWYIRGFESFLADLYVNPEIVEAICSRVAAFYQARAMRVIEAAGGGIDIIGSGGDLGTQRGMLIKPDIWREAIKPHASELVKPFKDLGLKTFYHSCGSIVPVIDGLIEIGVDILDPIQVSAEGMTPEQLFPAFGGRLTFHGAIDENELLRNGTPEQVYEQTMRTIKTLGANSGYIVAPTHMVQGDTPPENVVAIFRAVQDCRN